MTETNREAWLQSLVDIFRPWFKMSGFELPAEIKVSCGFPSKRAHGRAQTIVGQCWAPSQSARGITEIFISPLLSKEMEVSATLLHELVHASGPMDHGKEFGRRARSLGLEGKLTATVPNDSCRDWLESLCTDLGPYPHASLRPDATEQPKAPTALLKAVCPDCGYVLRVTKKWTDRGMPLCSLHDDPVPFILADGSE